MRGQKRKTNVPNSHKPSANASAFGKLCGYLGLGSVIAAIWFHSLLPVIIAGAGLFGVLTFMNSLA